MASDITKALGYEKPANAVSMHCRYTLKQGIPHPQNPGRYLMKSFPLSAKMVAISPGIPDGFHGRKFGSQKILFSQNGIKRQVRELHDGLEIKSNFTTWFDRMCENGLTENDYTVMWNDSKNGNAVEFEKMRITYWLLKKE